jgi:uncharacterized damage-inducible protein DinB
MRTSVLSLLMFALVGVSRAAGAQEAPPATGKTYGLASELLTGYQRMGGTLAETAEKMPEEHYTFRATPEVKPFGQLVAHVALSQFGMCARFKGEDNPRKDEKEETTRTRSEAIALLKASTAYCDALVNGMTDAAMTEVAKMGNDQVAKGLVPISLVAHGMEMYGTMAVYLRLKGIVPPTTERQNKMKQEQSMKKSE